MKILLYSSTSLADVTFSLMKAMSSLNHDVYCIMPLPSWATHRTIIEIENQQQRDAIIKASEFPEMSKFSGYVDIDKIYFANRISHSYSIKALKLSIDILRFINNNKFDIVQVEEVITQFNFIQLFCKTPWVLLIHDPIFHQENCSNTLAFRRWILIRKAKRIVLLNKTMKESFCKHHNVSSDKVYINALSVYDNLLINSRDIRKTDDNKILFFGRITPYKGIEYLCEAMKIVHEQIPSAKLVIAGKGKYYFDKSEYEKLSYIEIINRFIPTKELVALISESAFTVCPYVDATQSGVVMSSFAFCKPVISTNVGGLGDMIDNGKSGIMVEPQSSEALADAIIYLLSDRTKIDAMGEYIRNVYYEGDRSWKAIAGNYISLYNQIINS